MKSTAWQGKTGGVCGKPWLAAAIAALLGACGGGGGDDGGQTAANCGTVCSVNNVYVIGPGGGFYSYPICSNTCPPEPANQAPTANLAGPTTLVVGDTALLDSTANDADGDPLNYHWALLSKPAASSAVIADAAVADLSFTPDRVGRYLFSLVVDDGELEAGTRYHVLDVEDDALPGFALTLTDGPVFATQAVGVALGDLDGDAAATADVAIGRCAGVVEGHLNDGGGVFTPSALAAGLVGCSGAMVIGDFAGADAFGDVITYSHLLPNDGAGNFAAPVALPYLAANNTVGDFNGDGNDDVVLLKALSARGADDAAVKILHGDGNGNLDEQFSVHSPTEIVPLGVGDFDGDAIDDLVFYSTLFDANRNSELTVVFGDTTGTYNDSTAITVPGRGSLGVGDINGDGDTDIVVSYHGGTHPELPVGMPNLVGIGFLTILGNGDGSFRAPRDFDAANRAVSHVAIYDFDGDGDVDFVFRGDTGAVNILLGDGAGGITDVVLLPGGASGSFGGFAVGEIDGDALPDILLADELGPTGANGILRFAFGADNQLP